MAAARNTANRTMPFQYGTGSLMFVLGDDSTSLVRPAAVETTTATAPQRRPRFHVTRPIGIRYSSDSENCSPVR